MKRRVDLFKKPICSGNTDQVVGKFEQFLKIFQFFFQPFFLY